MTAKKISPDQISENIAKKNREFLDVLAEIERTLPGRKRHELVTVLTELGDYVLFSNEEWEKINTRMAQLPSVIQ
jgi:hypothetical protein